MLSLSGGFTNTDLILQTSGLIFSAGHVDVLCTSRKMENWNLSVNKQATREHSDLAENIIAGGFMRLSFLLQKNPSKLNVINLIRNAYKVFIDPSMSSSGGFFHSRRLLHVVMLVALAGGPQWRRGGVFVGRQRSGGHVGVVFLRCWRLRGGGRCGGAL